MLAALIALRTAGRPLPLLSFAIAPGVPADVSGCVPRRPEGGVKIPISVSYVEDGGLEMQFYSSMERLTLAH